MTEDSKACMDSRVMLDPKENPAEMELLVCKVFLDLQVLPVAVKDVRVLLDRKVRVVIQDHKVPKVWTDSPAIQAHEVK